MTLPAGARLGPYEILSPLGAGGMGEVYRARDSKLDRDVAIKVLPEEFAAHPDALARFEREAKAVAALNHPNILGIYDFGSAEGTTYSATELLDGDTLRSKLDGGPVPLRKAIDYAIQILHGLSAAHEKGIVHRDLKPENLFVTADGRVKILDFGLAKVLVAPASIGTNTPTMPASTEPGAVMGTVGYMSPEQVRGRPADHRSDIFSFGAVLYEMLSGKRAFQRESPVETMAAIAREEPPELLASGRNISPALDRIVRHCLEKSVKERAQSAHDLAFELASLSDLSAQSGTVVDVAPGLGRRFGFGLMIAAAAMGAAGLVLYRRGESAGRRSAADVTFRQMSFRPQTIFQAAFAPDGKSIIYSAAVQGNVPELFTIRPEFPEPLSLGLPRAHLLSISSKGELAILTNAHFVAQRLFTGTLARVSLGSTAPREILENVRQADWSPDGSDLAILRVSQGKDRLEFPIGKVLYESAGYLSDLRFSPGGDRIALFEHHVQWDDAGSVVSVDLSGKRSILSGGYWGEEGLAWSRSGDEILFTASTEGASQTLYGVDLSGNRRVVLRSAGGLTMHDISHDGRWLVTRDGKSSSISALVPGANSERDLTWLDGSAAPFLSRDGKMLLFGDASSAAGPNSLVCLRKTDGGGVVRLGEGDPVGLSPDGSWSLAIIDTPPQLVIYPTGPGETRRLPRGPLETYQSGGWFPDGKNILVCGNEAGKASRCYEQDIYGGSPRPVTPEGTSKGAVSPDGMQVLCKKPDGAWLVQPVAGGVAKAVTELVSEDRIIRWSDDGRSVFTFRARSLPFRIEQVNLITGRRELVHEVAPADRTGVLYGSRAALSDDARSYAYDYIGMRSQLFLVEGVR